MEKQGKQGKGRLVLVPTPFQGHITPMLQLGAALHSKGFSITVVHTKHNSPDYSNHPDFAFHALSDNLTDEDHYKGVFMLDILNNNCRAEFHQHMTLMLESNDDTLLGIINDDLMYFAEAIASDLKLPSFVFRVSNAAYLHALLAVPRLHEQGHIPFEDSMLEKLVPEPELYPLRFKDLPLTGSREHTLKLLEITGGTKTCSAIIWNTIDFLEQSALPKLQKHFQVPVFPVGPLQKFCSADNRSTSSLKEDRSCIEWLDKQAPNSVVYASLGSTAVATIDKKQVVETSWELADCDQPFLWVVQPGSIVQNQGSEWIDLFPEGFIEKVGKRGCIVRRAPQKEVLAHGAVGGFWSHGGWNSCLESLSEGVPMICTPCFLEHKVISRYLSYVWKVGLEFGPVLERGEIASAIRRLLVEKKGKEIRQRAMEMKEKIRACVQEGGSSYKSLNDLAEFLPSSLPKSQGLDTSSG